MSLNPLTPDQEAQLIAAYERQYQLRLLVETAAVEAGTSFDETIYYKDYLAANSVWHRLSDELGVEQRFVEALRGGTEQGVNRQVRVYKTTIEIIASAGVGAFATQLAKLALQIAEE